MTKHVITLLREWSDRSDDRYFEVKRIPKGPPRHRNGGRWNVRLEVEGPGWAITEEGFDDLDKAVLFVLNEAAREGFP